LQLEKANGVVQRIEKRVVSISRYDRDFRSSSCPSWFMVCEQTH
jgi:hypothetical protein